MAALSPLVATEPDNLKSLRKAVTQLQQKVEEERVLLSLLEGQASEARVREIFDQIDVNGNGELELAEFEDAARRRPWGRAGI